MPDGRDRRRRAQDLDGPRRRRTADEELWKDSHQSRSLTHTWSGHNRHYRHLKSKPPVAVSKNRIETLGVHSIIGPAGRVHSARDKPPDLRVDRRPHDCGQPWAGLQTTDDPLRTREWEDADENAAAVTPELQAPESTTRAGPICSLMWGWGSHAREMRLPQDGKSQRVS